MMRTRFGMSWEGQRLTLWHMTTYPGAPEASNRGRAPTRHETPLYSQTMFMDRPGDDWIEQAFPAWIWDHGLMQFLEGYL